MKKKFSKILSTVLLAAIILSASQSTVFATEPEASVTAAPTAAVTDASEATAAYGVEVALYLMESSEAWSYGDVDAKEWSEPKSESVFITEDGTYTLSLKDLDIPAENFMLCYIKDVAKYPKDSTLEHSNVPDDIMIITDVFKVNGNLKEVNASKVRTGLKAGIFDIAYRNNWDPNDDCVDFSTTVKSVEITFTVTGITGEPGALKYEPTQAPTPTVAAAAATVDNTGNTSDSASSTDDTSSDDAAEYSLAIIIGIAAIAVIAVIIIIVIRKKKK